MLLRVMGLAEPPPGPNSGGVSEDQSLQNWGVGPDDRN